MSESIREVRSDEVEILQDIAKRTFIIHLNRLMMIEILINF